MHQLGGITIRNAEDGIFGQINIEFNLNAMFAAENFTINDAKTFLSGATANNALPVSIRIIGDASAFMSVLCEKYLPSIQGNEMDLVVSGCSLDSSSVNELLQGISGQKTVRKLDLSGNKIKDEDVANIAKMLGECAELSSLRLLDIGDNLITVHGAKLLFEAVTEHELEDLDLSGNPIENLSEISPLMPQSKGLKVLHLEGISLTDSDATELVGTLPLCLGLETVYFESNNFSQQALLNLAKSFALANNIRREKGLEQPLEFVGVDLPILDETILKSAEEKAKEIAPHIESPSRAESLASASTRSASPVSDFDDEPESSPQQPSTSSTVAKPGHTASSHQ